MQDRIITKEILQSFREFLLQEEKSEATVEKYLRDVQAFYRYVGEQSVNKEWMLAYKQYLQEKGYAVRSINSMLASLSSLFTFMKWQDCKVKSMKLQKQIYSAQEKELTKAEYLRLLSSAKDRPQLYLVLQTICGTGIRVSELRHFTVEAVRQGEITVHGKGKIRTILIGGKLKKKLLEYARKEGIASGVIFQKKGQALGRRTIWAQMKGLCRKAAVLPEKVFPHNLRKLFARTFYKMEKDIARLADILGHSSIDTTRIYIMTTSVEHRRKMENLNLVL